MQIRNHINKQINNLLSTLISISISIYTSIYISISIFIYWFCSLPIHTNTHIYMYIYRFLCLSICVPHGHIKFHLKTILVYIHLKLTEIYWWNSFFSYMSTLYFIFGQTTMTKAEFCSTCFMIILRIFWKNFYKLFPLK